MHSELPTWFSAPSRAQWGQSEEYDEAVADVASDGSKTTGSVARELDGGTFPCERSESAAGVQMGSPYFPSDILHFFSGGVRLRMLVSSGTFLQEVLPLTETSSCVSSTPSSFATSAGASLSACIAVIVDSSSWGAEAMQGPGGGELSGNPASEQVIFAALASVSGCVL